MRLSKRANKLVGQEMFIILDKAKDLESNGKKIIHLELGQARLAPPPNLLNETCKSLKNKEVGYSSAFGVYSLRKKIQEKLQNQEKLKVDINNILISTANLLITQTFHLVTDEKDSIVAFTPTFPSYFSAANFLNLNLIQVPLSFKNSFALTKKAVDIAINKNPKVIIINSANNPTGAVYSEEVISYLLDRCLKKNIWLISDETYSDISYGQSFFSLKHAISKNVIVFSSFSKIYSIPGFRLGYALANPRIIEKLSLSNSSLISCLPIFTQKGVEKILLNDSSYVENAKEMISNVLKKVVKILNNSKSLSNMYVLPQAGFYIFIDISQSGMKSFEFCDYFLKNYFIACTPGICFGSRFDNFIRISICGEQKDLIQGIKLLVNHFDKNL